MRISRYFTDLMATYVADINDLKTDSGGEDVLTDRLKEKRSQIPDLMPMIMTNPEMMAVIFHRSIVIKKPEIIMSYIDKEPAMFPAWDDISSSVEFKSWASNIIDKIKDEAGGEHFLLTTVMLEHLYALYEVSEDAIEEMESEESDDLAESGGEWLSEQGFDSH
ncbi:MAG: hypothetical protein V4552_06625 [Pseudomonadota bacterium]